MRTRQQYDARGKELKSAAIQGVRTPQVEEWLTLSQAPPSEARRQLLARVIARSKARAERQARVDALIKARNTPKPRGIFYFRYIAPSTEVRVSKEEQAALKLAAEERAARKARVDCLMELRTAGGIRHHGGYYGHYISGWVDLSGQWLGGILDRADISVDFKSIFVVMPFRLVRKTRLRNGAPVNRVRLVNEEPAEMPREPEIDWSTRRRLTRHAQRLQQLEDLCVAKPYERPGPETPLEEDWRLAMQSLADFSEEMVALQEQEWQDAFDSLAAWADFQVANCYFSENYRPPTIPMIGTQAYFEFARDRRERHAFARLAHSNMLKDHRKQERWRAAGPTDGKSVELEWANPNNLRHSYQRPKGVGDLQWFDDADSLLYTRT
ncbi:hypothetical protein C8J57DRAFT_1226159 [Mycena rebaudengoi]|nr:hypothetical protein C8J57DRAFT_1226159 [Mycena rebaudengoi]